MGENVQNWGYKWVLLHSKNHKIPNLHPHFAMCMSLSRLAGYNRGWIIFWNLPLWSEFKSFVNLRAKIQVFYSGEHHYSDFTQTFWVKIWQVRALNAHHLGHFRSWGSIPWSFEAVIGILELAPPNMGDESMRSKFSTQITLSSSTIRKFENLSGKSTNINSLSSCAPYLIAPQRFASFALLPSPGSGFPWLRVPLVTLRQLFFLTMQDW